MVSLLQNTTKNNLKNFFFKNGRKAFQRKDKGNMSFKFQKSYRFVNECMNKV